MAQYRFGILGLRMGQGWAEGVARDKRAKLFAVFDPDQERCRNVAAKYGATPAATEDDFFKTDMDAVVVATPDHLHAPQSIRALSTGRHVICEKPLAQTVPECRRIIAAVRRYKRYFMVGQVCRYAPGFMTAKQLIADNMIGDVVFIESEYYHDYSHVAGVGNWRKDPKIRREGFIGGGCHALDLIRWLAGNPEEVFCYMNHKLLPDWPTNDTGVAIFKFRNNIIGKVFVSIGVKAGYSMRTVIHGARGSIICDNTSDTLQLFSESYRPVTKAEAWRIPISINNHNVAAEVVEFIDCLKRGKKPKTDEYEGANTVAFGVAALKSARTGKPVKIDYVF